MNLADRIDCLLDEDEEKLQKLVTAYFDPEGPFAGHTFDDLGSWLARGRPWSRSTTR